MQSRSWPRHRKLAPNYVDQFTLGVFPLVISSGAGAASRHEIGTGVIGGLLFATFLGLLLIPVFYVIVRRLLGDKLDQATTNMRPGG